MTDKNIPKMIEEAETQFILRDHEIEQEDNPGERAMLHINARDAAKTLLSVINEAIDEHQKKCRKTVKRLLAEREEKRNAETG